MQAHIIDQTRSAAILPKMASATKPTRGAASIAGATTALVLLTALNFVNYIDRYILPGVQEQIKGEFHSPTSTSARSPSGSWSPTWPPRPSPAGWATASPASP